jgi:hypothetical protein
LTGAVTSVGNATSLGSFTSAQLLSALTDETGTGASVFATSPTLVTPILGTPASGVLTNATGLPLSTGVTGNLPVTNLNSGTSASASTFWRGDGTWSAPAGGGTVTSVAQSFTGGIISVAGSPITASGTLALTVAGTSGGIPYFGSTSTWASSNALTQYGVVIGGGAGAAPTSTAAGTSTTVLHGNASGTPTFGAVSLTADVSGQLPVANGGTGTSTLTANNVILGNGTSAPNFVAPSTSGNVLSSNGTTWVSQAVSVPAGAQIYTSLNFGGF